MSTNERTATFVEQVQPVGGVNIQMDNSIQDMEDSDVDDKKHTYQGHTQGRLSQSSVTSQSTVSSENTMDTFPNADNEPCHEKTEYFLADSYTAQGDTGQDNVYINSNSIGPGNSYGAHSQTVPDLDDAAEQFLQGVKEDRNISRDFFDETFGTGQRSINMGENKDHAVVKRSSKHVHSKIENPGDEGENPAREGHDDKIQGKKRDKRNEEEEKEKEMTPHEVFISQILYSNHTDYTPLMEIYQKGSKKDSSDVFLISPTSRLYSETYPQTCDRKAEKRIVKFLTKKLVPTEIAYIIVEFSNHVCKADLLAHFAALESVGQLQKCLALKTQADLSRALFAAVYNGKYYTTKVLLEHGCSPHFLIKGRTPLQHAFQTDQAANVKLLLRHGAPISANILEFDCKENKLLQFILEELDLNQMDTRAQDIFKNRLLKVVQKGDTERVCMFLAHGFDSLTEEQKTEVFKEAHAGRETHPGVWSLLCHRQEPPENTEDVQQSRGKLFAFWRKKEKGRG